MNRALTILAALGASSGAIFGLTQCGPGVNLLTCGLGGNFTAVDELELAAGEESRAQSIAIDGAGRIFVGGNREVGASPFAIVRVSTDAGATWTTGLNENVDSAQPSVYAITFDESDTAYALVTLDNSTRLKVAKSSDHGSTWTVSTGYLFAGATSTTGGDLVSHGGVLYAAASAVVGADVHWLVLKSTDDGENWSVLDDHVPSAGNPYTPNSLFIRGDQILVTGSYNTPADYDGLLTRYSSDGGTSWATSEIRSASVSEQSSGGSAYIDPFGSAFVGGSIDTGTPAAMVRKTSNFTDWQTVDTLSVSSKPTLVTRILADKQGQLVALGQSYGGVSATSELWVRRATDHGSSWSALASKSVSAGGSFTASDAALADDGSLYVVGYSAASGTITWFVDKLGCD